MKRSLGAAVLCVPLLALSAPIDKAISGLLHISEPSKEYYFAQHAGTLERSVGGVGSLMQRGQVIMTYRMESGKLVDVTSLSNGYIEKLWRTPEIDKGVLLVKLQDEVAYGHFTPATAFTRQGFDDVKVLWFCSSSKEVRLDVNYVSDTQVFVSLQSGDLSDEQLRKINEEKLSVTVYQDPDLCG
ncbi:hypothetical protein [Pseudoalteromonas rubra]|uniref:DUF4412 domain-containing protein n=1 Tax=Pseudoalteromonas rubra TaxID=43658 RepID=A0A0F4QP27_9GAMM|nr:hypothetical protein [Pseudoalteromonas rubra]KJZ09433.1 hypothetical protein TW77_09385 [Pseudoalteromonas rubra]